MHITILLIALFVANEIDGRGFPRFALLLIGVAFLEVVWGIWRTRRDQNPPPVR